MSYYPPYPSYGVHPLDYHRSYYSSYSAAAPLGGAAAPFDKESQRRLIDEAEAREAAYRAQQFEEQRRALDEAEARDAQIRRNMYEERISALRANIEAVQSHLNELHQQLAQTQEQAAREEAERGQRLQATQQSQIPPPAANGAPHPHAPPQ